MRSYGDYLLLSGLLSNLPTGNSLFEALADSIFQPLVKIVSTDCQTKLGNVERVSETVVGKVELETDLEIDQTRLIALMTAGKRYVSLRTLSTCTSLNGVCQKCYATYSPTVVSINSVVPITTTTVPFYAFLAKTYSGSLVGIKALPTVPELPIRKDLIERNIDDTLVESCLEELASGYGIATDLLAYAEQIGDRLEKALLILTLYGIYSSVSS